MKRILITGFSGFVASHFVEYLYQEGMEYKICGIDVNKPKYDWDAFSDRLDIRFKFTDMSKINQVREIVSQFHPDYILHLAAFSSVAYSWEHPAHSFVNNSNIFLNLLSVVQNECPQCRILSVGSSEEYGNVTHEDIPIRESQPVNPGSPYAVARVAQEMLSKVFVDAYNLEIVMTRSFNHIGPRQDPRFVVPGFIKKVIDVKKEGMNVGEIETGDLSIIRDFVDVRDVVRAYHLLLLNGRKGEIYNICSGRGVRLKEVVEMVAKEVGVIITTRTNLNYIRPNDNMEIVGSPAKIELELGWKRRFELEWTIKDMVMSMYS